MRSLYKATAVAVLAITGQSTASAQVQLYNGHPDSQSGFTSEVNSGIPGGLSSFLFENYTVGGAGLTVTGLFGNYLSSDPTISWTEASWEVRSGITEGDGGTLLFFGTTPASLSGTGLFYEGNEIYQAAVSGLNFFLPAGEYWFALSPHRAEISQIFLASTAGAGGVNANLDGQTFLHIPDYGYVYNGGSTGPDLNFSLGVEGRIGEPSSTVPEPATMTLLATGLAGMAAARRRNRTKA